MKLQELNLVDSTVSSGLQSFTLYSTILRNYLQPTAPVIEEVNNRLTNSTGKRIVGMHIRCGTPLADFKDQTTFLTSRDIIAFSRCVKKDLQQANAMIVLASDSTKVKTLIRELHPDKTVVTTSETVKHTMTRLFNQMKLSSLQMSFTDMLMLSKSDVLVGTTRSTFSLTAGAFKGQMPYLVQKGKRECYLPKRVIYLTVC